MEALWTAAQVEGKITAKVYRDDDSFLTIDDHLPERITKFVVTDGAADRGCPQDIKPTFDESDDTHDFDREPFAFFAPLYMLDHSGVRISLNSFNDPWDSGCCGFVGVLKEDIVKQYGELTQDTEQQALQQMRSEVETISNIFAGNVYGYVVEERQFCESCQTEKWETVDSCWGFVGDAKYVNENAVESLRSILSEKGMEDEIEVIA
jgi:hypothetical protein